MRRTTTALLLSTLLPVAAGAQDLELRVPYERFTLPNGLEVILHEDHSIPLVSVNLWYHVGSSREKPGRRGFAHLFEHIMFEGSEHVPEGKFDEWLEAAGGFTNGSTNADRTNYWQNAPSNALELALFLESDRMGHLLEAMGPEKVDGQRDVVKNERRQNYENQPYGMASIRLQEALYPEDHPYHWPTIGYMDDLTAASYGDVVDFFQRFYGPNNATLAIAGDIDPEETKRLVERWFGEIPSGPPVEPIDDPPAVLTGETRVVLEDRVQLPRTHLCWLTPAFYAPGDAGLDVLADVLAGGKNGRLYRRLVYDMQIAQDVQAYQASRALSSYFCIVATARPGQGLDRIEAVIDEELARLADEAPSEREVRRGVNRFEASFLDQLEKIGGFGGKADKLNSYLFFTGNPDYFQEDLARYRALSPGDVQAVARTHLRKGGRVVLRVVPEGSREVSRSDGPGAGR